MTDLLPIRYGEQLPHERTLLDDWLCSLRVAVWNMELHTTRKVRCDLIPGSLALLTAARERLQELGMTPEAIQVHEQTHLERQREAWKPRVV